MTIDALVLLGDNRFGPSLDIDRVLAIAEEEAIDAVVAAPARPAGYHLEPANDAVAAARDRHPQRVAFVGRVDPLDGAAAVREAERCVDELGARGLFLHPLEEAFNVRRAAEVVAVAAAHDLPVLVAAGYPNLSEPLQIAQLAAAFPTVPFVATSGCQINIAGLAMVDAWAALRRHANIHVLTNGEYRQDYIEQLATELDGSRVMWASFAPNFDTRFERRRIRSADLSDEQRTRVEHDNAAGMFGLADAAR